MSYQKFPKKIAILGAAGKMGSGITLLSALEVTRVRLTEPNSKISQLFAVDISQSALQGLRDYLSAQIKKRGEKNPELLHLLYAEDSSSSDEELVNYYTKDVLNSMEFVTDISELADIELIFEAVNENPELKARLINQIKNNSVEPPMVFSNTSSIPIKEIEKSTQLEGRVIGFHFYNPPAVQKLIELVSTSSTEKSVLEFANLFAKNIKKIVVPSNDIPGFIGNGHFMRDLLYAFELVKSLDSEFNFSEKLFIVNYISQKILVRPMGIFQLIDYVGLDVCINILKVMNSRITDENLHSDILDRLFEQGISGGQNSDGSQKDGILQYEKGSIIGIYDLDQVKYIPIEKINEKIKGILFTENIKIPVWKEIINDSEKENILEEYFRSLFSTPSFSADIALKYLTKSKQIGENLVKSGVTYNFENVNKVLQLGFYHAYGPINKYC